MFVCLFISLHFYTHGQKIAKKLCAQIKKESREVLSMLGENNAVQESPADILCSSEAYDPCALRLRLQSLGLQTTGARLQERQEIMQAYPYTLAEHRRNGTFEGKISRKSFPTIKK